mgnify:CR=1 FL=1
MSSIRIDESTAYGNFGVRFLAAVIDFAIIWIVGLVLSNLVYSVGAYNAVDEIDIAMIYWHDFLLNLLFSWLYFALFQSSPWMTTVGGKALGVVIVDYGGNRISFARATGRYFATFISAFILLFGYLMIGWTRRKQGLHDFIANTLVVKSILLNGNSSNSQDFTSSTDKYEDVKEQCQLKQPIAEHEFAKILGLSGKVTLSDIKKQYKELALQYHPDKVSQFGKKLQDVAEEEMGKINEAYSYFIEKYENRK